METITEEIYFDDGTRGLRFHPAVPNGCVVEAGRYYSFELGRKSVVLGDVPIQQFWLPLDSIYGRPKAQPRNYEVLVEFYWAQCMQALTVFDDDVLDSLILAKLLPHFRRNGSRRIFVDSILPPAYRFGERNHDQVRRLDKLLAASRHSVLDIATFHKNTNELLGNVSITDEAVAAYQELEAELLGEGRRAVQRWGVANGMQVPIATVERWMRTFARRRGHEAKKLALDILSYEARVALHRCYSAVWIKLLAHLERKYELDQASVQFHRLMHFDVQLLSHLPDRNFHLFHGHVFALHPGLGLFFQTRTGGKLIGDYLRGGNADEPFRRLLHGICVATGDYRARGLTYADERKSSNRRLSYGDVEELDAAQTKGRGRRRLAGPKHE